jgi:hypothetical protein
MWHAVVPAPVVLFLTYSLQLMWALMTEEKPPTEAFNPEVKR